MKGKIARGVTEQAVGSGGLFGQRTLDETQMMENGCLSWNISDGFDAIAGDARLVGDGMLSGNPASAPPP